ncbi:MAG TPA: hypothetical protein VHX68_00390, partial [Planctomycetaceae bacterium]|nr:hypothetical protein [Planctomycetaceae bacterium]
QGVQRTPTNAGPVGTGMTVGGMGNRLTPPGSLPIQTQQGGTNSINSTQRLFRNNPYGGAVQGSALSSPMPAFNGTGFSTGLFRTNTSAYRAIPGPLLTTVPYSLGNPAYPNGQTPNNMVTPPANNGTSNIPGTNPSSTGNTYNETGRAQYGQTINGTRNPATGNEINFSNNSALQISRTPTGAANGTAGNIPGQPNTPPRPNGNTPQAPNGPIQYGWW